MIDYKLGINFENTDIFIPWNIPLINLKNYGSPMIVSQNSKKIVIWEDSCLLNGIKGNWQFTYYNNVDEIFNKIVLSFVGDKLSFIKYDMLKTHLLKILGVSIEINENNEKSFMWLNDGFEIYLHLYELHSYHCSLTIKRSNQICQ